MNGFFNNLGDLEALVHEYQPIVLAMQETHKVSNNQLNISLGKRYHWKHYNQPGHSYRSTAIGIRKDYIIAIVLGAVYMIYRLVIRYERIKTNERINRVMSLTSVRSA